MQNILGFVAGIGMMVGLFVLRTFFIVSVMSLAYAFIHKGFDIWDAFSIILSYGGIGIGGAIVAGLAISVIDKIENDHDPLRKL